eukprot:749274-Hanusia_phi.AAC.4
MRSSGPPIQECGDSRIMVSRHGDGKKDHAMLSMTLLLVSVPSSPTPHSHAASLWILFLWSADIRDFAG